LVACAESPSSNGAFSTATRSQTSTTPEPSTKSAVPSPLASPLSSSLVPIPTALLQLKTIGAPASGRIHVSGTLVRSPKNSNPNILLAGDLYLGKLLQPSNPRFPPSVSVLPGTDPRAIVDQSNGEFVFLNVPPGRYGLLITDPGGNRALESTPGNPIVVEVTLERSIALGRIPLP
jgi:hypothetical protein